MGGQGGRGGQRIVFLGGLHRSGTTPLARWLAQHPQVSGLAGTQVPEDEGQHLQHVYAPANVHGGPGRFAFDRSARLTESSPLVDAGTAAELLAAWSPFWDMSKDVLIEKSPPNLIRMRFLRALFPDAAFIMIVRHPIAVAMATRRWSGTSVASLVEHWAVAHQHLIDDAQHVGNVVLVRYEDLMRWPSATVSALFAFLNIEPYKSDWPVNTELNRRYFDEFDAISGTVSARFRVRRARRFQSDVERFGYSIFEPRRLDAPEHGFAALDVNSGAVDP
jgi:hypothetical protein